MFPQRERIFPNRSARINWRGSYPCFIPYSRWRAEFTSCHRLVTKVLIRGTDCHGFLSVENEKFRVAGRNFLSTRATRANTAPKKSLASPTRVTRENRAVPFSYRRASFSSLARLLFLYPAGKIFFQSIFSLLFPRIFYYERIVHRIGVVFKKSEILRIETISYTYNSIFFSFLLLKRIFARILFIVENKIHRSLCI